MNKPKKKSEQMNAKRLTAYRVATTLVLLVSALAGLSSPSQREGDVGGC